MQKDTKLEWVVHLRGIAALWVFAYHIWLALGGLAVRFGLPIDFSFGLRSVFRAGYQGVDLFFVLSGFVIAWPYVVQRQTHLDRYQLVDFYQRRYLRIAPIYYVTMAVAVVLISLQLLRGAVNLRSIVAHLFFAQNFDALWLSGIRGVYWTLPTEIHFYLLFPLVLRFVDVDRPFRLVVCVVLAAIGYRFLVVWLADRHLLSLLWTTYLPARIDQFGCGMAAACLVAAAPARRIEVRASTVVLAGLLALASLVLVARNASYQFDFWFYFGASITGVAIAIFVWTLGVHGQRGSRESPPPARGCVSKLFYLFGEASLSIYLWHTFFIDAVLAATDPWRLGVTAKALLLFATVPLALGISVVTYRLIEAPVIAFSKSEAWRERVRRFVDRISLRR